MVHSSDSVAGAQSHPRVAVPTVDQTTFSTDTCSALNSYLPAKYYTSDDGKAYDACMDKAGSREESSADAWCSIGMLYQQQKQYMDALQAYMCAVQLDRSHSAAWTDLGVLYETCGQAKDALTCYTNAVKSSGVSATAEERLTCRIRLLQQHLATLPASYWQGRSKTLPSIQDAWSLPIPAELTSRHVVILPGASDGQHRSVLSAPRQDSNAASQRAADADATAVKRPRLEGADGGNAGEKPSAQTPSPAPGSLKLSGSLVSVPDRVLTSGLTDGDLTSFFEAQRTIAALTEHIMTRLGVPPGSVVSAAAADDVKCRKGVAGDEVKVKIKVEKNDARDDGMNIDTSMTAEQISVACKGKGRTTSLALNLTPCASQQPAGHPLPLLPPLSRDKLSPPTPSVYVASMKDAFSDQLKQFCIQEPTVVIRGIANAVQLDLGLFSTKSLVEANPDHVIEVRNQKQQPPDENSDSQGVAQWRCESSRSHTSIAKYAQYQAASYQDAIREEEDRVKGIVKESDESDSNSSGVKMKKYKMIRFGTNLDLSDEKKWRPQLQELNKLPDFLKVACDTNMLSYMGLSILGMNTVQLYMKVPGSRTPGHQENLNYCSVNINIGPGDCEWFCTPHEYWSVIAQLCESNGVHYLKGSWWPGIDDLHRHNVPVYRFIQKPGDLVWVGSGTVHWVQAIGWCNNIAWNVGPMTSLAYELALDRYEYNKLVGFKSIVPLVQLSWNLARKVKVTDARLFDLVRRTISLSLQQCFLVLDLLCQLGREVKWHGRTDNEVAHYCNVCEVEVFNLLFVTQQERKNVVHCGDCALKMSRSLHGFVVLNQYRMDELMDIYDSFTLAPVVSKDLASV